MKYYVKSKESDGKGYLSDVYTYQVSYSRYELPTINVINLTRKYSNGKQKIFIQTNQPYQVNITNINYLNVKRIEENKIISENEIPYQHIINENTTLLISQNNKVIEYDINHGQRTRMNYTYSMNINYQTIILTIGYSIFKF